MSEITKYQYIDGFHAPKGLPADVAALELENIRVSTGQLIAENVVNAARAKENPLHVAFEWRDDVAAHQHRLQQAYQLTRSITVVREDYEQPYRMFTLVRGADESRPTYQPTETVVQRIDLYEDGVARLKKELSGAQKSVQELVNIAAHLAPKHVKKLNRAAGLLQKAVDLV